ncbi:pyridoxal phosphate-dependent aminotransferase [Kallotenue papyrolyticum]|uniref:pyridoxal phosphate-dependent aminotransferase n=1 Tax=Kallotenue papyrolyticum TaxID=1325125 RepID=UPI000478601D|nr:aminotransferase class I/II-fold pyridoxal phosphate-dependent enzyme [Kallotenue papyrolyticum]
MATLSRSLVDVAEQVSAGRPAPDLSALADRLSGSAILKIAAEVRALQAAGQPVLNLTVGDFSPKEFPIPAALAQACVRAFETGQTNYPPSDGVPELRAAIARLYERELGLRYPLESIIVQSGGRPGIYAAYLTLVDPGEAVLYPLPSWNNNYYCQLVGARAIEVPTDAANGFMPTAEALAPHIGAARLVVINTPVNPTGTVMPAEQLRAICDLILEENHRRARRGARGLYLLFDQIYWMLTFGAARHVTPVEVAPEMAAWTIMVDGISKSFAATGLRVGWTIAPPDVAQPIRDIIAHAGAWAPKPVQVATAELLDDAEAVHEYHQQMKTEAQRRLDALYQGFQAMRAAGLPVDCLAPQGAIYLSARLDLLGRSFDGRSFTSNDDIRRFVLEQAGFAVVPFDAFGFQGEPGWVRLSVGAVSLADIESGLQRLHRALERVR